MKLFDPATNLMKTLKYPKKFALISFVFLLPLSLLMALLFAEIESQIQFTKKEQAGNQYLRSIHGLTQSFLSYRVLNAKLNLTSQPSTQLLPSSSEVTQDLQQLERVNQAFRGELKTQDQFKKIQTTWDLLKRRSHEFSPETEDLLNQQVSNFIHALQLQVGDQSNLILDPDLDTYYLMDTILLQLPEIQEILIQIQLLSQQVTLRQQFTSTERSQLLMLTGSLQRLSTELDRKLQVAFNNNAEGSLQGVLSDDLDRITSTLKVLIQQLNGLSYDNQSPQTQIYFSQAERSLEQSFVLWNKASERLNYLLQLRIERFKQKRTSIIAFVVLILALATYLFIGFYQGLMQVVSSLSAASKRMVKGNLQEPIVLDSQDELAEVVRSFNTVADALREAEANYRGIFENSVEGIFQTSPDGKFLAANPMLAKIYGYESPTALMAEMTNIGTQLYVDPNDRDKFVHLMHEVGKIQNFETQVYRKDGSIIWISESARAILDTRQNVLRYEGTVVDISQRKQAEFEIEQLTHRLHDENLRMRAELSITRQLQQMLLPTELELNAVKGLDIAGFMEPAAEVGGDYYDVLQQDGKVNISIGDVTGHGLESGVVMIMAQTAVRTLLANGETDARKLLGVVNQIIYENTRRMRSRKNMTLALLEYDSGSLRVMGQHEEIIVVRQNGTIEAIDTLDLGFPLGLESDISAFVNEITLQLQPADVAVLYTDGITEAMNLQNQQYGLEQMYTVLQKNRDRSALEIRQAVIQNLMQHIGDQRVFDDITLVVIKRQ
ncbi:MAG: SpoIIE family protein phosphatase [Leptolyngbyaceae cyanobacterium bins.302]|nr:SpoIIE family protein phosphatase [Leptolyngbyaceae cyanobacterium bins.302]